MRVFYGIALISGAVLMKGEQSCVFAIAHKIGVALFVVLFIQKTVSKV